jgi:hypothetical protein
MSAIRLHIEPVASYSTSCSLLKQLLHTEPRATDRRLPTTVANDCEEEDLWGIVRFLTRVAMAPYGGNGVATADLSVT